MVCECYLIVKKNKNKKTVRNKKSPGKKLGHHPSSSWPFLSSLGQKPSRSRVNKVESLLCQASQAQDASNRRAMQRRVMGERVLGRRGS